MEDLALCLAHGYSPASASSLLFLFPSSLSRVWTWPIEWFLPEGGQQESRDRHLQWPSLAAPLADMCSLTFLSAELPTPCPQSTFHVPEQRCLLLFWPFGSLLNLSTTCQDPFKPLGCSFLPPLISSIYSELNGPHCRMRVYCLRI